MSKIFCDVGEVPIKKKRGTKEECAEKGQVKLWGENKVDKKTLKKAVAVREKKVRAKSLKQLEKEYSTTMAQITKLKLKHKKLKEEMKKESEKEDRDEKEEKRLCQEINKCKEEYDDLYKDIMNLKEKIANKEKEMKEKETKEKAKK